MKKLNFLAALCCMLAVFTACEKNEPSDNTNGNGINTDQNGGNSNTGSDNATGTANGHEYVNLGLPSGLKWATCNVGATSPEEYGNYFAWGEVEPKKVYDWSTYKWCNGAYNMTKYCTDSNYGIIDNKTVLEKEDDAAAVNMGGSWRMPTKAEQDELLTECTWTRTTLNEVGGIEITSKINGNSIFWPYAGRVRGSSLSGGAQYWSSTCGTWSFNACHPEFKGDKVEWYAEYRSDGRSVRGVCE